MGWIEEKGDGSMGKLYLISGDDDFAVKAKGREIIAQLCNGEPESDPALEIIAGDADAGSFADICSRTLSALQSMPFLADHQIIWLRNFAWFDALCSAYKTEETPGQLAGIFAAALPEEQTVVINGSGLDQRKALVKAMKSAGAEITLFQRGKSTDRNFAENRRLRIGDLCREAGKKIAPDAVAYLSELIGTDVETMHQEVNKLLCYVGDVPEITLADCRAVCSRTPEAVSWNFTGALVERNARTALEVLDSLMRQGDAVIAVMGAVSKEFQNMVKLKLAMRELQVTRVNPRTFDNIPEDLRKAHPENMLLKMHPYRAFKVCEGAGRFTDEELTGALQAILEANRAIVSGGGEPRMVLEQLIFRIAGNGNQNRKYSR